MPRDPDSVLRTALVLGALAFGTYLRVQGIADVALCGDEYHTLLAADANFGAILTSFDSVGSHVPLPLLQRIALDVFGDGVVPFRLAALVPGILTLLCMYPFARELVGPTPATIATFLLAFSPIHVYYSRFARSYALVVLLALLASWALARVLASDERRTGSRLLLVASAALLPYVHLSSAGFVLALGLAGSALAWRRSARRGLGVLALFAGAALLCALLFLPIQADVRAYFGERDYSEPPLSVAGVPILLAGGRTAALLWTLCAALGLALTWRERRDVALLALAGIAGPLAVLLATLPPGMDYAYSRYLLAGFPGLLLLVASGFAAPWRHLVRDPARAERVALGSALALLVLGHASGPLGRARGRERTFSNTYLALEPLPAFDAPFPGTPAFYADIARDPGAARIVEALPIFTRATLLYRNYALQHGKGVLLGWDGPAPRGARGAPYAQLFELGADDADYVVLHRDPLPEVHAYFRFVYDEAWPGVKRAGDASFMKLNEKIYGQNLRGPEATDAVAARLRERFGPAAYKDERYLVWKLGDS